MSKGTVYYGMHFYPGVAEYAEPDKSPYRVFLNEDTIRAMDPSFAGCPVFVMHVDEVNSDIDALREEADGWVIESFFNSADGKHWVKFIVCSERGEQAIARGMRLSNCYAPRSFREGGLWNGVSYAKEIASGEYEHLAIVPNPRYEESVIMTPEEFKEYNATKEIELKRLANHDGEKKGMAGLNFFKRAKVENAADFENMLVVLPKSKREVAISQLVQNADEMDSGNYMVNVGGSSMTLNELVAKHKAVCDELEAFKMKKTDDAGDSGEKEAAGVEERQNDDNDPGMENDDNDAMENDEDEDAGEKKKEKDDKAKDKENAKKKNAADRKKADADELKERRAKDKVKADRLRNADTRKDDETATVSISDDQVARGRARYGSN